MSKGRRINVFEDVKGIVKHEKRVLTQAFHSSSDFKVSLCLDNVKGSHHNSTLAMSLKYCCLDNVKGRWRSRSDLKCWNHIEKSKHGGSKVRSQSGEVQVIWNIEIQMKNKNMDALR